MTPSNSRRTFLTQALAGGAAGVVGASAAAQFSLAADAAPAKREVYQLWLFQMTAATLPKSDEYFQHALLPAIARAKADTGPVGVFVESSKAETPVVYVLIPHANMQSVLTLYMALQADAEYQKTGESFLATPPKQPIYVNHEARLMLAAGYMPALETPEKKDTRVFELRRYRSPSEAAFRKKLEMFATTELTIFPRVGLNPVFFGEMLFGPDMFNITYMLTYPDADARAKSWGEFGKDSAWLKLRATPGYTDPEIIANISSLTLKPTSYSQI